MPKYPDFQKLWDAYPTGDTPAVGKLIGGAVGSGIGQPDANGKMRGWITNTCAIRLSRSFNYAGNEFRIPQAYAFADRKVPKTFSTIAGGDKLRYAFRVAEFLKYLREKFGKAPVSITKERGDSTVPDVFKSRKGLIVFDDCGWSDATGHIDLWNGSECRGKAYWQEAKRVFLWTPQVQWAVGSAVNGQVAIGSTPIVTVTPR